MQLEVLDLDVRGRCGGWVTGVDGWITCLLLFGIAFCRLRPMIASGVVVMEMETFFAPSCPQPAPKRDHPSIPVLVDQSLRVIIPNCCITPASLPTLNRDHPTEINYRLFYLARLPDLDHTCPVAQDDWQMAKR